MMRTMMGVLRNSHGVFVARRHVPNALQEAVARATNSPKERVAWLQKSLGTKDRRQADTAAKPVLMEFERVIAVAARLPSHDACLHAGSCSPYRGAMPAQKRNPHTFH